MAIVVESSHMLFQFRFRFIAIKAYNYSMIREYELGRRGEKSVDSYFKESVTVRIYSEKRRKFSVRLAGFREETSLIQAEFDLYMSGMTLSPYPLPFV
jgi:hypothetical protein